MAAQSEDKEVGNCNTDELLNVALARLILRNVAEKRREVACQITKIEEALQWIAWENENTKDHTPNQ